MKTDDGEPILHVAVKSGNIQIVNLLLNAGADQNSQDVNFKVIILKIDFWEYTFAFCAKLRI